MKIGDQIEISIDKMSLHGGGVARHEGLVIFVDFAAPGDQLLVEITELKKSHAFAKIKKILSPSSERTSPACPVFGRCGGCQWQHLSLDSQKKWKEQLVHEALLRAWQKPFSFIPMVESPLAFNYRNRIQVKKRGAEVGYFARGSHSLVAIENCPLAEEPLNSELPALRQKKTSQEIENWEISLRADGLAQTLPIDEREVFFAQVNRSMNELLIQEVVNWAKAVPPTFFWDLYAGSGNFSFPLGEAFPKARGLAVELSESAVLSAQKELARTNWSPKRLEFFKADVGLFVRRAAPPEDSLVLIDPPRAGLDATVVQALALSKARQILYISCNPMSLARDLKRFREASSRPWKLHQVRCFDMFPQTDHVETLVELRIDTDSLNVNV